MEKRISIDPKVYVLWAFLLLIIPIEWLFAAILAAAVHELSHLLMIWILGCRAERVCIHPGGAEICTGPMVPSQELLCALAGPAGSFSMVLLCRFLPRTAICALIQGLYNSIPLYPLDGGRAVRCLLWLLIPAKAENLEKRVRTITAAFLLASLMGFSWYLHMEKEAGILACIYLGKWLIGKKPCKPWRFNVQ